MKGVSFLFYGIVYLIWNKINGKKYVGQTTKSLQVRFNEHARRKETLIGKAIRKYGKKNFYYGVIKSCSTCEELNYYEKFFIAVLHSQAPIGYNLTSGGENASLSEITRIKISLGKRGEKNHFFGKRHTAFSRMKIALKHRGYSPYQNLIAELDARQIKFTEKDKVKLVENLDKPINYVLKKDTRD